MGSTSAVDDVAPGSPSASAWAREVTDVVRAASGGLLFGVPLLYTMEVWWTGSHASPVQVLGVLALTAVPVYALNRTAGFRSHRDVRAVDAGMDTVEALGIGLLLSALVLVVLRELTPDTPIRVALGEVIYEALPFCLGIGFAHHVLAHGRDDDEDEDEDEDDDQAGGEDDGGSGMNATVADLGATVVGSVFVAISIAPTDEVPMLASAMAPGWLLVVVAASLLATYGIVFVAGFSGQEERHTQEGLVQDPITETIVCYLLSLLTAGVMLAVFQRGDGPASGVLAHVVVLGLPAAVGGAAGRLAT